MQPLTPRPTRACAAIVALALLSAAPAAAFEPDCPWIVQPGEHVVAEAVEAPHNSWGIRFEGTAYPRGTFYGFSVTSPDVVWRIAKRSPDRLPDLRNGAVKLAAVETAAGRLYKVDPRTAAPATLFLVAAAGPVDQLEAIDARIEPERAIAVSALAIGTRGGSDISGALPAPVVPGFLIAEARAEAESPMQICAYEVALR